MCSPWCSKEGVRSGHIHEVKSISGKLSKEELAQFDHYMKIREQKIKILDDVGETVDVKLELGTYVFTNPVGAKANLSWALDQVNSKKRSGVWVFR